MQLITPSIIDVLRHKNVSIPDVSDERLLSFVQKYCGEGTELHSSIVEQYGPQMDGKKNGLTLPDMVRVYDRHLRDLNLVGRFEAAAKALAAETGGQVFTADLYTQFIADMREIARNLQKQGLKIHKTSVVGLLRIQDSEGKTAAQKIREALSLMDKPWHALINKLYPAPEDQAIFLYDNVINAARIERGINKHTIRVGNREGYANEVRTLHAQIMAQIHCDSDNQVDSKTTPAILTVYLANGGENCITMLKEAADLASSYGIELEDVLQEILDMHDDTPSRAETQARVNGGEVRGHSAHLGSLVPVSQVSLLPHIT